MKLSKSKLALAKVINENGGWVGDAKWSAQDNCIAFFNGGKPEYKSGDGYWYSNSLDGVCAGSIAYSKKITNWHQCVLSREEYYQAYPKADADGWIEWKGCECPVGLNIAGDVMLNCGETFYTVDLAMWNWLLENDHPRRIIAYRLHKPESKPDFCESVTRSIPEPEKIEELAEIMGCNADIESIIAVAKSNEDWIKQLVGRVSGKKKETSPTIEQLAQDYRNAKDYADRLQKEADEACAKADSILCQIEHAGEEIGFIMNPIKGD